MIKIDHTLLCEDTLENLLIDIITRQATEYGEFEIELHTKKQQLKQKLISGDAIIVFNTDEDCCDIIRVEDFKSLQEMLNTST